MKLLSQIEPLNQFRNLFGGSFNEVATKVAISILTILWSIANDTAYLLFIFLLLLMIDVVLGVILSRKKKIPFNGFYVFAGPGFKLIITSAVMVAMAILDNLIRSTPVGAVFTQPLAIGVGGAVCFAMGLDVVTKYAELSGNTWIVAKVRELFGRMMPPTNNDTDPPLA